jgi:hypothetical protein
MPDLKSLKRTYQAELQSLPIQLVPPDPLQSERARKSPDQPFASQFGQPAGQEPEKETVNRLIRRIKKI